MPDLIPKVRIGSYCADRSHMKWPCSCQTQAQTSRRWRHKKRGTIYTEICRAELQAAPDSRPEDGELMIVYRGEDGNVWVRGAGEFNDGRFEEV